MGAVFTASQAQVINLGDSTSIGQNVPGLTTTGWVRITSIDGTERHWIHITTAAGGGTARIHMSRAHTTGKFRVSARRLDTDSASSVESIMNPSINTLYFLVIRAGYNSGALDIFVDGALENTLSIGGWTGNSSNTAAATANLGGRGAAGAAHTNTINGTLYDPRIYHRALTADEIAMLYQARGRDWLVGQHRWTLMGPAGGTVGTVRDKWIGNLNGTAEGTTDPIYVTERVASHRSRSTRD